MLKKKRRLFKFLFFPAIGFGIGGVLWGWECYRGTVGTDKSFTNPFSFILGAIYFGFFGSLFLNFLLDKQSLTIKKLLKMEVLGIIGCVVGFIVSTISVDLLLVGGSIITPILGIIEYFLPHYILVESLRLEPSLIIGHLWFGFLITGIIITFFHTYREKKKLTLWRGGIGFALASFVSPVIGNFLSVSLFFTYFTTFFLIGFIFGLFLGLGIWKSRDVKENP